MVCLGLTCWPGCRKCVQNAPCLGTLHPAAASSHHRCPLRSVILRYWAKEERDPTKINAGQSVLLGDLLSAQVLLHSYRIVCSTLYCGIISYDHALLPVIMQHGAKGAKLSSIRKKKARKTVGCVPLNCADASNDTACGYVVTLVHAIACQR